MDKQKKRILALLVAMAFTVGSQAQVFGLGGEAEGPATRSNNPGLFWIGMDGGGNNGGQWNGMNGGGNNGGQWNGMNGGGNGGASWNSMEDATPVGDGLLLLAVSGMCYAAAKNRRKSKVKKIKN
ncbi:MAG: hypothetical protein MJZ91_02335 [Bacteroidales bacterium]|nr:hypothetical protein [Bacteroidales bacterium]